MKKVLVADEISELGLNILSDGLEVTYRPDISQSDMLAIIENYHGLLVRSRASVDEKIISNARSLEVIGRAGVGVDNIDVNAATKSGVLVLNSPEGNTASASEHTMALMFALARKIAQADKSVKEGHWKRSQFLGSELFNKTLGIIGFGKIGRRVANMALAIGMKVIIFDPLIDKDSIKHLNVELVELEKIYQMSDFITIHTPKTKQTTNLINHTVLNRMKDGVFIINTSRGGIIDERALALALLSGKVAGCGLDVFEHEPLASDSPLREFSDKIILTPHLGASTYEAQLNVALDLANQIKTYLLTGISSAAVNLPNLKPEELKFLSPYIKLTQNMATIASNWLDNDIREIEISVSGNLANYNTQSLTSAAIIGALNNSVEGLNFINASYVANDHGINIRHSKFSSYDISLSELNLVVNNNNKDGLISLSGMVLNDDKAVITKINEFNVNLSPSKYMLFTVHQDQPGMVAKVALILGQNNINISSMAVSRKSIGAQAMMVIELDENLNGNILEQLNDIDGILKVGFVNLYDNSL